MKRNILILLTFLIVGSLFAQKAPTTKLISSSEESIVVQFDLNGFTTAKVMTPQGEQFIVNAPKMGSILETGAPDLPLLPIPAIIGDRAEMTVSVIDAQYTDYDNMDIAPSKVSSAVRSTLTTCHTHTARCTSRTLSGLPHKPIWKHLISSVTSGPRTSWFAPSLTTQ